MFEWTLIKSKNKHLFKTTLESYLEKGYVLKNLQKNEPRWTWSNKTIQGGIPHMESWPQTIWQIYNWYFFLEKVRLSKDLNIPVVLKYGQDCDPKGIISIIWTRNTLWWVFTLSLYEIKLIIMALT